MQKRNSIFEMTVDDLTFHIQGLFTSDLTLKSLVVSGELAELKKHTSGHCYFTLLGKESRVACAIFKQDAVEIPKWPQNGDKVLVEGRIGLYAERGVYQLYARRIIPVGAGAIDRARQELKERLTREGLFNPELKRPIPTYPSKVAIVTSATGAALRDVLNVSARRYPSCNIIIIPAQVQGTDAPDDIVRALSLIPTLPNLDCVLLVRGGGSREDLVTFDDERVVRAVRSCPVPLVSGVGHEVDITLCDMAADLRAPTPSAAAELVFPDRFSLAMRLSQTGNRLSRAILKNIKNEKERILQFENSIKQRFLRMLGEAKESLLSRNMRLSSSMRLALYDGKMALSSAAAALNALSPLAVLERGFVTCERDGRIFHSVKELSVGEQIEVHFSDGCAVGLIEKTLEKS